MSSSSCRCRPVDVFQASLLNLISEASDIGINNLFENKVNELHRFILTQYIHSLTPCHPLRSELIEHHLNEHQKLSYYENDSAQEVKLKNEWLSLLTPSTTKTLQTGTEKSMSPSLTPKEEDKDKEEDECIDYKSISRSCWIYIVQNYLHQNDKIHSLSKVNHFFNDLATDTLVWKKLFLSEQEINLKIPWHYGEFEVFLSRSCTNLHAIQFEFLAKDCITWQKMWKIIATYCLALKHIHIGLFHGIWKFEFNQLEVIYHNLFHNVAKHIHPSLPSSPSPSCCLPLSRIECAPGVMPKHIVSFLKCARALEHFFIPLIYNDNDNRWDAASFWDIPSSLPPTLKSFRGFDAKTPLRFVHQCIANLPNIEEFHVVLYFGSAHPDFLAMCYTAETLQHLASHCRHLTSFEGYFDSTKGILHGIELMIGSCAKLRLMGFLFHPSVRELDICKLIRGIEESAICSLLNPKFKRLTENPNAHVTLRVVEIAFDHSMMRTTNGNCIKMAQHQQCASNNGDAQKLINLDGNDLIYGHISGVKSLDEIDFDDDDEEEEDDDDDDDRGKMQIGRRHDCDDEDVKEPTCNDANKNTKE